jgi:hypothetical protein
MLATTAWLRFAPQSSPERPAFNQVLYVADASGQDARLVSAMSALDDWSRSVLDLGSGSIDEGEEPAIWLDRVDVAATPRVPFDPATAAVSAGAEGR